MRRSARVLAPALGGSAVLCLVALGPTAQPAAARPQPTLQQLIDQYATGAPPFIPALAAVSCPVERGPVKEGADADRFKVSTAITGASMAYLVARPKPSTFPKNNRLAPYELKTWQVNAMLTQYKQETDGDLHLVITDTTGHHMIAEIPYPACVPTSSRWKSLITSARTTFTRTYAASTSWHYVHRSITLRGLALFDPLHGQTGVASNGIELHPVTIVAFH